MAGTDKLARMRAVHEWSRTWKNLVVEPGTTGKIVGHDRVRRLYSVEWPGHEAVWVDADHVDVLLPGDSTARLAHVQVR